MFNQTKFNYTSIAALSILSSVILKNTLEQSQFTDNEIVPILGKLLFAFGWLFLAYALSLNEFNGFDFKKPKTIIFFACAIGVLTSVFLMKAAMKTGNKPEMYLPIIFATSWFILGYFLPNKMLGLTAASLVTGSMMFVLPWQRKNCVIDGPGMPMFTAAWALIIYANSHVF